MQTKIIFFLLISFQIFAQNRKTVEVEVSGRPTWQQIIPLGKDGLILFVKSDVTKAIIVKFDTDLKRVWESEIFLDAEREPTAFTVDNEQVTFMFSENQGMYYQLFKINLKDGKFENKGFELREFFQDQDYVYLNNRVLMAGTNEKGAAFYNFKFDEGFGEFISADLTGTAQVQLFKYQPEKNTIETLWSIKDVGYKDEKKKKGAFTKDAYIVYAKYDTTGKTIIKHKIESIAGNFPITAKLTEIDENTKAITGTFQSNAGAKGLYLTVLRNGIFSPINFIDYRQFLKGNPNLEDEAIKKITDSYNFLSIEPVYANDLISVGGSFFKPDYQTITKDNPYYNPYGYADPYGRNSRFGGIGMNQSRTQSSQIFKGYSYINGFVASIDLNGNLVFQSRIDMNQISPQINETMAIAENKSVAYCIKGNVGVGGVTNLANPQIYKLADDTPDLKNQQFIAGYNGVRFWYENNFIAIGNRIKYEAVKQIDEDLPKEKPSKRSKKQKQSLPQTNIKKIIYLSKIEG